MNRREGLTEEKLQERREQRHESRTASTYKRFLHELSEATSLPEDQAERAAICVVSALEDRIIGEEARHLSAQLPQKLQEQLRAGHDGTPQRKIGRQEFFELVGDELQLEGRDVADVCCGVFRVLSDWLAEGEIVKVVHGLPRDLRELWPDAIQLEVEAKHQREREAGRAMRDALREQNPEPAQSKPREELVALCDRILELPQDAQLGVLRMVVPKVMVELDETAREGFLRDLMDEIGRAENGDVAYDFRAEPRRPDTIQ